MAREAIEQVKRAEDEAREIIKQAKDYAKRLFRMLKFMVGKCIGK